MNRRREVMMVTLKYVSWQEDDGWLGDLEGFPDSWTQGETLDDLIVHLRSLDLDMTSGSGLAGSLA